MADEPTPNAAQGSTEPAGTTATQEPEATSADQASTKESATEPVAATASEGQSGSTPPAEFELKAPEGSMLDADDIARIKAEAKSQDEANRIVEIESRALAAYSKEQQAYLEEQHRQWDEAVKSDPVMGGDHQKETLELNASVLRRFGDQELDNLLESTGFVKHPAVRRFLRKIGKAASPDKAVFGDVGGTAQPMTLRDALYGKKENKS